MRICIYGAGSLGTVLGAFMAKAGLDVDLVSRNEAHVRGLKSRGARVTGTIQMTVPVRALLPGEMAREYDLIFLMTKQQENGKVVPELARRIKPDGALCTFQNGLPEVAIAEVIGQERTFGAAVAWGATLKGDGESELTSEPESLSFSLGSPGRGNPGKLEEIRKVLETMGTVIVEKNFLGARWSKLLVNASFSGMSAVLGCTFGEVAANRGSRLCAQRIIKECIDVAARSGIRIEPIQGKDVARLLDYSNPIKQRISFAIIPLAIRKHRSLKASMLQDLEKGKPTEVDAINGAVCEFGRAQGVPTPYNDRVRSVIHRIEAGELTPSPDNLRFFDALRG